jgi:RNA polymerase-binding transcription factor DksA
MRELRRRKPHLYVQRGVQNGPPRPKEKKVPRSDASSFQRLLEEKHKDLVSAFSNRDEIVIENTADEIDRLQQQMSREVAIRNLDHTSKLLKSVQAALDRIEDDVYGVCLRCEEPIA